MTKKLEIGEKYLKISIGGKGRFKIALFKNKEKKNNNQPDFVGSIPIALWITKKKGKEEVIEEDLEIL